MARITVDASEELETFIREQAAKVEQRPGEYLKTIARAVYLAHHGDMALLGMLVPLEEIRRVFGPGPAAAPVPVPNSAPPPSHDEPNKAAIDNALDDYT